MKQLVRRDPRFDNKFGLLPEVMANDVIQAYGVLQEAAEAGKLQFLPFLIGEEAWALKRVSGKLKPACGKVSEMFYTTEGGKMQLVVVVHYVARGIYGRTIFRTEREALAAIGEDQQ